MNSRRFTVSNDEFDEFGLIPLQTILERVREELPNNPFFSSGVNCIRRKQRFFWGPRLENEKNLSEISKVISKGFSCRNGRRIPVRAFLNVYSSDFFWGEQLSSETKSYWISAAGGREVPSEGVILLALESASFFNDYRFLNSLVRRMNFEKNEDGGNFYKNTEYSGSNDLFEEAVGRYKCACVKCRLTVPNGLSFLSFALDNSDLIALKEIDERQQITLKKLFSAGERPAQLILEIGRLGPLISTLIPSLAGQMKRNFSTDLPIFNETNGGKSSSESFRLRWQRSDISLGWIPEVAGDKDFEIFSAKEDLAYFERKNAICNPHSGIRFFKSGCVPSEVDSRTHARDILLDKENLEKAVKFFGCNELELIQAEDSSEWQSIKERNFGQSWMADPTSKNAKNQQKSLDIKRDLRRSGIYITRVLRSTENWSKEELLEVLKVYRHLNDNEAHTALAYECSRTTIRKLLVLLGVKKKASASDKETNSSKSGVRRLSDAFSIQK